MNEKIQTILLKIVVELKKLQWKPVSDWEITLKSEGHVSLTKQVNVTGNLNDADINDTIETYVDLKFESGDEITYYPKYIVYASILISGGDHRDIMNEMDVDVAITEEDFNNHKKLQQAAEKIDDLVGDHIQEEYDDYISANARNIKAYKEGEWKADDFRDNTQHYP